MKHRYQVDESGVGDLVLLRVPRAAEVLDVSISRVWQLVGSGELKSVRIGASRRIPIDSLRAFVRERMEAEQGQDDPAEADR